MIRADRMPFLLCFGHGALRASRGFRIGAHARRVRGDRRPRRSADRLRRDVGRRRRLEQRIVAGYRQRIVERRRIFVGQLFGRRDGRRRIELRCSGGCSARRADVLAPRERRQLHSALAVLQRQVQREEAVRERVQASGHVQLRSDLDRRLLHRTVVQHGLVLRMRDVRTAGSTGHRRRSARAVVLLSLTPGRIRPELPVTQANGSATRAPNTNVR